MHLAIDNEVRRLARILWEFHALDLGLQRSDFVLAMGSHDLRVAKHAAELVLAGMAPILVVSGGLGKVTRDGTEPPEGERFATVALEQGVPGDKIIVEGTATNTGENITRSRDLLARRDIPVQSG